jgi:hypothetical protein
MTHLTSARLRHPAARAAEHDVHVELQVWPQVPDVFRAFAAMLDETAAALRAAVFTRAHWAATLCRPAGRNPTPGARTRLCVTNLLCGNRSITSPAASGRRLPAWQR